MKKKGFTLIELLAVIVILSVISLITVPIVTSVIEESKKKALVSSVQGLIESANLYAIENEGVYEFLFDREHQGSTQNGESLEYKGKIEGEGKLYLDKEGNTSICISNDKYYVYKNYNSEIMIGERSKDNCNIEYDALTNKYVAFLESKGSGSNVYSKDEVDNLVDGLDTKVTNLESNIEELQNNLNNYAHQSELEKTNTNVENLSSLVTANQASINDLNNKLQEWKHLKTVTGKTEVILPETYSELFVIVRTNTDETNAFSFSIPSICLSNNIRYFTNGYAIYADTNYGHFVRISASKTKIVLAKYSQSIGSTSNEVSSKAIIEVYYK